MVDGERLDEVKATAAYVGPLNEAREGVIETDDKAFTIGLGCVRPAANAGEAAGALGKARDVYIPGCLGDGDLFDPVKTVAAHEDRLGDARKGTIETGNEAIGEPVHGRGWITGEVGGARGLAHEDEVVTSPRVDGDPVGEVFSVATHVGRPFEGREGAIEKGNEAFLTDLGRIRRAAKAGEIGTRGNTRDYHVTGRWVDSGRGGFVNTVAAKEGRLLDSPEVRIEAEDNGLVIDLGRVRPAADAGKVTTIGSAHAGD